MFTPGFNALFLHSINFFIFDQIHKMKIFIYSSLLCPYCDAAKALLTNLKLEYNEILIDNNPVVKKQMIKLSKRNTVPQIFFWK